MTVQVRAGQATDADAAVAIWRVASTARRDGVPLPDEHEQRVRGYLAATESFLAVASDDDVVVGVALGMQALDDDGTGPPLPGLCHISMVFVDPGWWGRGVGQQLMQYLLRTGRDRGYERFQLWTHTDNHRAQRLYEGIGFRRSGREMSDENGEWIIHYEMKG